MSGKRRKDHQTVASARNPKSGFCRYVPFNSSNFGAFLRPVSMRADIRPRWVSAFHSKPDIWLYSVLTTATEPVAVIVNPPRD